MSPIERAARALCLDPEPDYIGGGAHPSGIVIDQGEPWWTGYVDEVLTVLTAIREPSKYMLEAGGEEERWDGKFRSSPESEENAKAIWSTMIDAALAEDGR